MKVRDVSSSEKKGSKKGNALIVANFVVEAEFGLIKLRRNEKDNEFKCNKRITLLMLIYWTF